MAQVFNAQSEIHETPNRNNFDMMHKRHMSGKFGFIYPFLVQPVVPTDDWEIDTAIGVNLNPMWYPTQSNMRFIVHYFYVPYRIMYKDWKNYINGLDANAVLPYHDISSTWFKTGTLADFLGIPTNFVSTDGFPVIHSLVSPRNIPYFLQYYVSDSNYALLPDLVGDISLSSTAGALASSFVVPSGTPSGHWSNSSGISKLILFPVISPIAALKPYYDDLSVLPGMGKLEIKPALSDLSENVSCDLLFFGSEEELDISVGLNLNKLRLVDYIQGAWIWSPDGGTSHGVDVIRWNAAKDKAPYVYVFVGAVHPSGTDDVTGITNVLLSLFQSNVAEGENLPLSSFPFLNPWCSENHTDDKDYLKSFAARGYEMIYNSYYRNQHGNQPFVVDGEPVYNQYIPSDAGDGDTYVYKLHKRNWELDAYTSCLPSPQQGNAPLVGVTIDGQLRVTHEDGSVSTANLREFSDGQGLEVTRSNIANAEDARTIISVASSGMTISDFRQGNALTRFLEQSLRSGFRYADFLFGHFGKSPSHQELDMPIFLGGYTQIVDVNKVTNVSAGTAFDNPDNPKLGQFAGASASFGSMKHKINHYFDDYGMVFGLMMLVPDAAYSQILPKHFLYSNRLDFYFPEFSQLGLQPVTYSEICPIQSHAEYVAGNTDHKLTDTFGYQRPNHDLVWLPDTVHGLFRTSLQGSVIQRRFGSRPELSDEFLTINPDECNDIFSVIDENEDTWSGQVVCAIKAKRPVPHVVVPSLGR